MIRICLILIINMLFYSCIDIITDEEFYESIYLQRSGWFEFYEQDQSETLQFLADSNSTTQVWFSGEIQSWEIAPCILNIKGETNQLSIYRTLNTDNQMTIYLNDNLLQTIEWESMDLSDETKFYLLSAIVNNNQITLYINDTLITESPIEWTDPYYSYQIGTSFNENDNVTNLWYGYIDEIRIWNTNLNQEIIEFHYQYPYKVSSSYDQEYLEHLVGLWDFKINTMGEESPSYIFQDINENQMYTILYTSNTGQRSELSIIGR